MFKSPSAAILKQCHKCGMNFDNFEQLATHQKKFCYDSDYGTLSKLELKKQEYNTMYTPRGNTSGYSNSLLSPQKEIEIKRLPIAQVQSREIQMQDDIERIKQEKAIIRLKKQNQEEMLVNLMREVEHKNDRDLRARIEKDSIRKDLADLENSTQPRQIILQKKNCLEELLAEREFLRQKEQQLIKDIEKVNNEIKVEEKLRDRGSAKTGDILDEFKNGGSTTFRGQEGIMTDRNNRIVDLQIRKEDIENERNRIMENKEKIKNGDFNGIRRQNSSFSNNSSPIKQNNALINTSSPVKSYDLNSDRPRMSTSRQNSVTSFNDSPAAHRIGSSASNGVRSPSLFSNNANNILLPSSQPSGGPAPASNLINPHNSQPQSLEEVLQLKARYLNSGGQDPNMLRYIENLENFFRGLGTKTNQKPNEGADKVNSAQIEALKLKEQEGAKLRKELEMLKAQGGPPQLNGNGASGNFTLADMNLKLNGIDGQNRKLFNIYSDGTEFFIQNEARAVDLNSDEKMAVNIDAQEADGLRILSQLPIGTELYRFKLDQFKELSTSRAEMEKILQEQMLLKMRRKFETSRREQDRVFENEKWITEQRKNILARRLQNLNTVKHSKAYDPTEGLVIHWDYLLSVPKKNDSCQIVYGIYINGNEVYPPSMVEPHDCEIDTSVTNRCIFGTTHPVTEIPANANALLIFEVQLFPSKDSTNPRLTSFGWSQLDLFDAKRELKRGKFKVPLYECPTDTNQDIDGIRDLVPVQNGVSWLYLRISYPFDDDIGKMSSIYPENTHMEYNIPQIHLRNGRYAMDGQFNGQTIGYMQGLPPPTRQTTSSTNRNNGNNTTVYPPGPPYQEPPQQPPQVDPPNMTQSLFLGQPSQNQTNVVPNKSILEEDESDRSASPPLNQTINKPTDRKALNFIIHAIRTHVARSHLKISCALYEEDLIVVDDLGNKCVYNTTIHNPLEAKKDLSMSVISGPIKMNNKAQGQDIIFKEEHTFMKDVNRMIQKNFGKKDYYLMFQLLEKPEPNKIQTDSQSVAYNNKVSDTANFGGMEYDLKGWFLYKLNKAEGGVNVGKFIRKMFKPGLRKPPLDMSKISNAEFDIEFGINEVDWPEDDEEEGNASMSKSRIKKKGKKKKKKKAQK